MTLVTTTLQEHFTVRLIFALDSDCISMSTENSGWGQEEGAGRRRVGREGWVVEGAGKESRRRGRRGRRVAGEGIRRSTSTGNSLPLLSCMYMDTVNNCDGSRLKHEAVIKLWIARPLAKLGLHLSASVRQQTNSIHTVIHSNWQITFKLTTLYCNVHCVQKKNPNVFVISSIKLGRFWWNLAYRFPNKFAAKSLKVFYLTWIMSIHYLVKLEMLIGHVLPLSCYRKKLHSLSHFSCGPKFAKFKFCWLQRVGTIVRKNVQNTHHWSWRTKTATENSWIMSSLRQPSVSGVVDSSSAADQYSFLYTFSCDISHMLLSVRFESGEFRGYSCSGMNSGVSTFRIANINNSINDISNYCCYQQLNCWYQQFEMSISSYQQFQLLIVNKCYFRLPH